MLDPYSEFDEPFQGAAFEPCGPFRVWDARDISHVGDFNSVNELISKMIFRYEMEEYKYIFVHNQAQTISEQGLRYDDWLKTIFCQDNLSSLGIIYDNMAL
jgi:hypothetical protein